MSSAATGAARLAVLAGLAITANLATAAGYLVLHGAGRHPAAPVRAAGALSAAPTPTAVSAVLQRRSRAVMAHDRTAFLATVDPSGQAFRAGQQTLFDNLAKVPLASWRESLADTRAAAAADDGWTAHVRLAYLLRGFDASDGVYTEYLTFGWHPGAGWVISGDGTAHGLRDDPQIWDGGPLTVVRGRHSLVIGEELAGMPQDVVTGQDGASRIAELRDIARRLDAGVAIVSGVVGNRWPRRVVALAPATEQAAEGLVGNVRNLGDIAAMATVTGDDDGPRSGTDRVIITPTAFDRLNALGRHVVLTHELVHVAMGGARDDRTPMWLLEGLADYAGYKNTGVSTRAAAGELTSMIAAAQAPAALPDRAAFGGSGDRLSAAYEEAWLACRMIAERYGEAKLVWLYRTAEAEPGQAGDPSGQERALRRVLGLGSAQFTAQWQRYLRKELA